MIAIKERNLCEKYIDAIFRPLFEDPSADNHFVWSDAQWLLEKRKARINQRMSFEIVLDLIRIGHLSKQSIDNNEVSEYL
ncbi:hypothetical protein BDB01DRAFT_818896 [Pilobolus umbonatus]|nr:hypothetical protein BDB01DRAFT_818896 [Pilobolus umbonatus]